MNKKIFYLMHVPWQWIKQRPHFLAEGLSHYFEVTVAYPKSYRSAGLTINEIQRDISSVQCLHPVPFRRRHWILEALNTLFLRFQVWLYNLSVEYSIVWVTHPEMYEYTSIKADKIIYDCMDDALEFPNIKENPYELKRLFELERELCERCDILICSSEYLRQKVISRYNINSQKTYVVNNGINLKSLSTLSNLPNNTKSFFRSELKKIVYVGTLSEWFDFDVVLASLDEIANIEYLLFGPSEIDIPHHDRITYCGSIQHDYVSTVLSLSDVLIMPFKVNELIKSVNPVKAYEYIYSGKPTVIVKYGETEKFSDFVQLYDSTGTYIHAIKSALQEPKPVDINSHNYLQFIETASWKHKTIEVLELLEKKV